MELAKLLVANWDTIGLIFTNIVALFMQPPKRKNKEA
jgi:hypothetical protein